MLALVRYPHFKRWPWSDIFQNLVIWEFGEILKTLALVRYIQVLALGRIPRILRSLTRLLMILLILTRSLFSEKMLISNRYISGLMPNLIKKSWTLSNVEAF